MSVNEVNLLKGFKRMLFVFGHLFICSTSFTQCDLQISTEVYGDSVWVELSGAGADEDNYWIQWEWLGPFTNASAAGRKFIVPSANSSNKIIRAYYFDATNAGDCFASVSQTVQLVPECAADVTITNVLISGLQVEIEYDLTGADYDGQLDLSFDFGNDLSNSDSYTFDSAGVYNVCAVYSQYYDFMWACSNTDCETVTVGDFIDTCGFDFTYEVVDDELFMDLFSNDADTVRYRLYIGEENYTGYPLPDTSLIIPLPYNGTFPLRITYDGFGPAESCKTDTTIYIEVTESEPCGLQVTANYLGDQQVLIDPLGTGAEQGFFSVSWEDGYWDGFMNHTFEAEIPQEVCITFFDVRSNTGCHVTQCLVYGEPTCEGSINVIAEDHLAEAVVEFEVIPEGNAWIDWGDGTTSSVDNLEHFYTFSGSYEVCLWVESGGDFQCENTFCTTVEIVNGISSNEFNSLSVFPNPVSDRLFINLQSAQLSELHLFNAVGSELQFVIEQNPDSSMACLHISHIPAGLYYLHMKGFAGTCVVKD